MADQDEQFQETRKLKRRHLIYYLEVFDDASGDLLGHLVDLTVEGMKLVSKNKIEVGKEFTMKMIMPEEYSKERFVRFQATSMWSNPDVNPDFFATGFKAPGLDLETRNLFMDLINQVGQRVRGRALQ